MGLAQTERNLAGLHPNIRELVKQKQGTLVDVRGKYRISIRWGWNEQAEKDRVFEMTVTGPGIIKPVKMLLDLNELLWYTRVM